MDHRPKPVLGGEPQRGDLADVHALRRPQPEGRPRTKHPHQTRIFTAGTDIHLDSRYKHSRVKQYLKEGNALRIETVINKPDDLRILARLQHLPELVKARVNGVAW